MAAWAIGLLLSGILGWILASRMAPARFEFDLQLERRGGAGWVMRAVVHLFTLFCVALAYGLIYWLIKALFHPAIFASSTFNDCSMLATAIVFVAVFTHLVEQSHRRWDEFWQRPDAEEIVRKLAQQAVEESQK